MKVYEGTLLYSVCFQVITTSPSLWDISHRQQIYCPSAEPIKKAASQSPTGWSSNPSTVTFIMHTAHHTFQLNFLPLEGSTTRNNIMTSRTALPQYHRPFQMTQISDIWPSQTDWRFTRRLDETCQSRVITVTYRREICRLSSPVILLLGMHVPGMFSQYKSQQLL